VKDIAISTEQLTAQNKDFLHKIEKRTEELEERMDDLHLNVNNLNRYSSQQTSLSIVSDYTSLNGKASILNGSQVGRHTCHTRLNKKVESCIVLALAVITLSILGIFIVYGYDKIGSSEDSSRFVDNSTTTAMYASHNKTQIFRNLSRLRNQVYNCNQQFL
jgi:hypothetical protein